MIVQDPIPPTPLIDFGVEDSKAGGVAAIDDLSLSLSLSFPDVTLHPESVTPRPEGKEDAGKLMVGDYWLLLKQANYPLVF